MSPSERIPGAVALAPAMDATEHPPIIRRVKKRSSMRISLRDSRKAACWAAILLSLLFFGWASGEETAASDAPAGPKPPGGPAEPPPQQPGPIIVRPPGPVLGVDTVVAMVNGEAITLDDLHRQSNPILAASEKQYPPDQWPAIKERLLIWQLESLIDRKLILMEARQLGARVEESRVREFIMSLPDVKRSEGDLAKYLVAKGITYPQLCNEVEELLLFNGMLRERVLPNVRVSPGEIRQYYERNKEKFIEEAAVHCYAISFLKRETPEEGAQVMTRAREALQKIRDGDYFPDVAKEYSEDPLHAEKGGDWGWITPGRGPEKKASEAAFALKEGEFSGIVEGDAAYWILWVKEKRERNEIPFSAAWKEIELYLKTLRQDVEVRRWGQRLRVKAAITYPVPLSQILRR